jgi:hypothetical protein
MSEPKKKSPKQRNIDKIMVARAESRLAKVAEDYVATLLADEMDPSVVPIGYYLRLIDARDVLEGRRLQQRCRMVAEGWPRTDDDGYIYDDITLESYYQERKSDG